MTSSLDQPLRPAAGLKYTVNIPRYTISENAEGDNVVFYHVNVLPDTWDQPNRLPSCVLRSYSQFYQLFVDLKNELPGILSNRSLQPPAKPNGAGDQERLEKCTHTLQNWLWRLVSIARIPDSHSLRCFLEFEHDSQMTHQQRPVTFPPASHCRVPSPSLRARPPLAQPAPTIEPHHIHTLPHSILHEIFSQDSLGPKDLCAVSATCLHWNRLNKDAAANKTWKDFYSLRWMVGAHELSVSWQHMYGSKMRRIAAWSGKYTQDNFYGHKAGLRCLKLLPTHNLMATGSLDKTVRLWSLTSGLPISVSKAQPGTVKALALDSRSLVTGGMDNSIRVWEADNSNSLLFDLSTRPTLLQGHIGPVSCLSMAEDCLFSGSWDYSIRIWSRSDWSCSKVLKFTDWVWAVAARGSNLLISAGNEVLVHDLATGKVVRKFQNLHDGHVSCLEGTQNSKLMFSGAADGLVMQHDLRMKDPSSVLWHHTSGVNGLAFEDPWLASCSSDGSAMLMNYEAMPKPGSLSLSSTCRQFIGPGGPIYTVDIADQWLACGADSEVVRTWDFTKAVVMQQRAVADRNVRKARRSSRRKRADLQPKLPVAQEAQASGSSSTSSPSTSPVVSPSPCFQPPRSHNCAGRGKQPTPHPPNRGAPGQIWQIARPRSVHQPSTTPADKRAGTR